MRSNQQELCLDQHHMKLVSDAFKPAKLCLDQHHMKLVSDAFKPARTMSRSAPHEACF